MGMDDGAMTQLTEIETEIAAAPTMVWDALTDRRQLEQWFCEHAEVDLDAMRMTLWGRHTPLTPGRNEGHHVVLEASAPNRLRFEWPLLSGPSTVDISLEPTAAGTLVTVRHEDIPAYGSGEHPGWRNVWQLSLHSLRAWLELGEAPPKFDYASNLRDEIRYSTNVRADRATTWRALLDTLTAGLRPSTRDTEDSSIGVPERGGDPDSRSFHVGFKLLELVENERFSYEWQQDAVKPPVTVVTWTLGDSGGGTRLTMVHSGFASDYDGVSGMAQGFYDGVLLVVKYRAERGDSWSWTSSRVLQTTV